MSKKIGKITLPWAEKFRELCYDNIGFSAIVVEKFAKYCNQEEKEINRKFSADREECRRVRER